MIHFIRWTTLLPLHTDQGVAIQMFDSQLLQVADRVVDSSVLRKGFRNH